MKVFRLAKPQYSGDLSGRGAELYGGRWNSKGTPLLYTSETRALCLAEVLVHLPPDAVPDLHLVSIEIPDGASLQEINPVILSANWQDLPYQYVLQNAGNVFVAEKKHLVLKVPSAVVPDEFNYLLNPLHLDFSAVSIVAIDAFAFDRRLVR